MNKDNETQIERINGAIIFAEKIIRLVINIRNEQGNGYLHSDTILENLKSRKTDLLQLKIKIYEKSK